MDRARDERDVDTLMGQFHEYLTKKQLKSTRQRDIIARPTRPRATPRPGHASTTDTRPCPYPATSSFTESPATASNKAA